MGNVNSTPDEGAALYLRDQNRLSISSVVISSPRRRTAINIVPNAFPATRVSASRSEGDNAPIEFIQDTEPSSAAHGPVFLLKVTNEEELLFNFTFIVRRQHDGIQGGPAPVNTNIKGLSFVSGSNPREVQNLLTREFEADVNIHKNPNVELVGDFSTDGSPSVTFQWTWKWKPPKPTEDKGGGWRSSCSFVEYDPRAHKFVTLASFSFFVANNAAFMSHPNSPAAPMLLSVPPKIRAVSTQSISSQISAVPELDESVLSPALPDAARMAQSWQQPPPKEPVKVDVSTPKPNDDNDDGPIFRAHMKALERKTGNMRMQMKKLIKKAEQVHSAQLEANEAFGGFMDALKEVGTTNANAVSPAIEHYFNKIAREILSYEKQNARNLHRIFIEPMNKLYQNDIKQAEAKKRDFEDESKDYYAYVSRYLSMKNDAAKAKQSDTKYQTKRMNFELKRFDYSSYIQDLSGGRKDQEILSHLTKYADTQARLFQETAQKVDALLPELQALSCEVTAADKEYQYQKREREEKRRLMEMGNFNFNEPEIPYTSTGPSPSAALNNGNQTNPDGDLNRADSTGSQLKPTNSGNGGSAARPTDIARLPGALGHSQSVTSPPQNNKFRGIRDLEERDPSALETSEKNNLTEKQGLLWALNRPGGHVDPRSLNKPGWHKFWIVLDQGKLSEYSNWKQKLDLHMDPIDLRLASVREARNADRRFCFEVITPHFKRVYQATSEEDMNNWIMSINNALQSAVEGRAYKERPVQSPGEPGLNGVDIGSMLTGKSPSAHHSHHVGHSSSGIPTRRITVGARPGTARSTSFDENPDRLLQMLRENDQGNSWCADCGSNNKVEWVSLNLAIIVCIECSGIHRSLGTHISKIRSLTLDTKSFTPDIIELLILVGNRVSNMVYEARLDRKLKPMPQATREQRLRFITAKYVERAFVEPISPTLSRYPTPEETLVAAVKKNEVQQVIYALALGASPNLTDKSRGTHVIFLALIAADPATPSSPPPVSSPAPSPDKPTPFPVAELLIQNGAEIPLGQAPFPLTRAAQLYLEAKRHRRAAVESSGGSYDGVGALPAGSGSVGSGSGSGGERLAREREARLQKRVSAGGRLAKAPIPER